MLAFNLLSGCLAD